MLPNQSPTSPEQQVDLRQYLQVIQKHLWIIITVFIVLVTTVAILTFRMVPIYQATTTILIDKENPAVVNIKEVMAINSSDLDYYQTQYGILKSESLARRVIERLSLQINPDFNPPPEKGFQPFIYLEGLINQLLSVKSKSKAIITGTIDSSTEEQKYNPESNRLVGRFLSNLNIAPERNSRLVKVGFESTDPVLAARG